MVKITPDKIIKTRRKPYHFTHSECQIKNEFLVSKKRFTMFLKNNEMRNKLGLMFVTNVELC